MSGKILSECTRIIRIQFGCLLGLLCLQLIAGCQTSQSTGPDGSPTEQADFQSTLNQVESMKTEICKAFTDGQPDEAHDALHEVGHVLEQLPELANKAAQLSESQVAAVQQSVEQLFNGFGQMDDQLHGGDQIDVATIEKQLSQALTDLRKVVP